MDFSILDMGLVKGERYIQTDREAWLFLSLCTCHGVGKSRAVFEFRLSQSLFYSVIIFLLNEHHGAQRWTDLAVVQKWSLPSFWD